MEDVAQPVTSDLDLMMSQSQQVTSENDAVTSMSPAAEDDAVHFYELARLVYVCVDPVLVAVGLLGNVLMLVTVQRKKLRTSPVSVYISAMAVSDALVLISDFLNNWIDMATGIKLPAFSDLGCKLYQFFFSTFYTYASWTVVALSIERLIVVCFPFRAKAICTRQNAIITVVLMAVPIIGINLFHFWTFSLDQNDNCDISTQYFHFQSQIAPWISGALYSYIPALILIFCNAVVIVTLARQAKARKAMLGVVHGDQHEVKVTRVVIVICVTYLILTTPVALYYAVQFSAGEFVYQGPEMALAEVFIGMVGLCHYGISFFLYILTSHKFRAEFLVMLGFGKVISGPSHPSVGSLNTASTTL